VWGWRLLLLLVGERTARALLLLHWVPVQPRAACWSPAAAAADHCCCWLIVLQWMRPPVPRQHPVLRLLLPLLLLMVASLS
jgi:hypothetical protein